MCFMAGVAIKQRQNYNGKPPKPQPGSSFIWNFQVCAEVYGFSTGILRLGSEIK